MKKTKIAKRKKKDISFYSRILLIIMVIFILVVISLVYILPLRKTPIPITNFDECVQRGYLIMESYPRQCRTRKGELFVEKLSPEELCKNLYNGTWLEKYNECENVNEEQCSSMGGEFNECASACRNEPNATVCITLCVPVCKINN